MSSARNADPVWLGELAKSLAAAAIPAEAQPTFRDLIGRRVDRGEGFAAAWSAVHDDWNDWMLYRRACADDEAAQREFYTAWRRRATAYYRRHGHRPEVADDLYQQFCERLLRYRVDERFSWTSSFRAYCYTILRTVGYEHQRREGRHQHLDPEAPPPPRQPDELALASERVEQFRQAFDQLSDLERRILMKFYAEGASARAIGEALGFAENTVHQRLSRARKRLQQLMSGSAPRSVSPHRGEL